MGTIATKLEYLNTTKEKIRDSINLTGANLTSEDTFRSYASKLKKGYIDIINNGTDTLYNNFPKVSGKGSNLSLTPTYEAPMGISVYGDTLQQNTPTPDTPVEIQSVTGLQNINVCGKNLFDENYIGITSDLTYKPIYVGDGTFMLSTTAPSNSTNGANIFLLSGNVSSGASTGTNGVYVNRPIQKQSENGYVTIAYRNTLGVDPRAYKTQLEQGSTATTYEPYKGNTYEVNLGKNLFNNIATNKTLNGITFTVNGDKSITANGTATTGFDFYISNSFKLEAGTYTLSDNTPSPTNETYFTFIDNLGATTRSNNDRTKTILNSMYCLVRIVIRNGATLDNIKFNIQLEKGTQATSYSPYFTPIELNKIGDYEDSIKKSTGKNLFDKNDVENSKYIKDDGTFGIDATAFCSGYIEIIPNINYYISGRTIWDSIGLYDSNKTFLQRIRLNNPTGILNINNTNCKYIRINANISNLDTIQVELGNSSSSYEPYGKVWYIKKNIGKYVYNNDLSNNSLTTDSVGMLTPELDIVVNTKPLTNIAICNMMGSVLTNNTGLDGTTSTGRIRVNMSTSYVSSYNEFKTLASNNNLTIYYVLKTPIYEVITNTELINQLESIKSKTGTTNINVSSEYLPAILGCSALKNEE